MGAKLTYQVESWASYHADAQFLWPTQYKELCQDKARMAMAPDVAWYEACEAVGILQIVTGRDANGFLAGYQISIIRPHTHYQGTLCGFEDTFWLDPLYRKGLEGLRLIRASLGFLRKRGVQRAFFMSIESYPTDRLFQYLGFKKTHSVYSLWLGD